MHVDIAVGWSDSPAGWDIAYWCGTGLDLWLSGIRSSKSDLSERTGGPLSAGRLLILFRYRSLRP